MPAGQRLCVRLNRLGSADGLADAAAFAQALTQPVFLMLPKVEQARDLELLAAACPPKRGLRLIALLESPLGVEAAFEIARSPAVSMPMFGSFDYAQKRNALRIGPCS
jgi:citrate lyase beta subunit